MAVTKGVGGYVGGGYDFNKTSEILAMKTSIQTTKVGALTGGFSGAESTQANTGLTATKVGVMNEPYDTEWSVILALDGV